MSTTVFGRTTREARLFLLGGALGLAAAMTATADTGTATAAVPAPVPAAATPAPDNKAPAEAAKPGETKPAADKGKETGKMADLGPVGEVEIKYDELEADFGKGVTILTGNVVVTEPRIMLKADKAVCTNDAKGQPLKIEASGNVVIDQFASARHATAGKAVYDVVKGVIVLSETPFLKTPQATMVDATEITYYRDDERVTAKGGKIITSVQKDGTKSTDSNPKTEKNDNK